MLWHVSLLVPPERKASRSGSSASSASSRSSCSRCSAAWPPTSFDRRKLMLITQIGGAIVAVVLAALAFAGCHGRLADLRARGDRRGGRRVRSAGASGARADARAARASAERDQPEHGRWCRPRRSPGPALGGIIIASASVGWAYALNACRFSSSSPRC